MKKTIVKMLATVALGATLISCAGGLLNAADIQAAAAGKVTVDPYIEYMFDDDEDKANNYVALLKSTFEILNKVAHFVYCYANTSKELVKKNMAKHSDCSESIIE